METPKHASESDHYAWSKRSTDATVLAALEAKRAPQLVRAAPPHAAADSRVLRRANSGGSPWNSAGTWEKRDISAMARAKLADSLRAFVHESAAYCVSIARVDAGSGSVSVVFVRGKTKLGFELSDVMVTVTVCEGEDGASTTAAEKDAGEEGSADDSDSDSDDDDDDDDDDAVATCVLKIAELNDDEGPDEWEATLTNGAVAPDSAAKAFVKAEVVPAVFRAIVAWRDGLVEEMTLSPP
tara:strand:- start:14 stop:733 length:720 start_codon:yes stop_codon:yes gene_type:complete